MTDIITPKQIVKTLDRAAGRAGDNAATPKQTWFLATLMAKLGDDGSEFLLGGLALSKRLASELIETSLVAARAQGVA